MSTAELARGPAFHLLQKNNQQLNSVKPRNLANANEETRSVRTERHYDKSARSNRSQENKSEHQSVRSSHSNNQKKSVESSHDFNKYGRLSSSLVSQPDQLVCDNCLNHKIHDNKVKDLVNQRDKDKEHARRVNENLKKQLEDEKRRHLDKLKLYQDAIDNQRADQLRRKDVDRDSDAKEKDRIRQAMANNDDLVARQQLDYERKQVFIHDLKEQLEFHQKTKIEFSHEQQELDRKNHNLLIDDAWREPHRKAVQEHYKNNLVNQLADNRADKDQDRARRHAEDPNYKTELERLKARDNEELDRIAREKKGIFNDELGKQLQDKQNQRDIEKNIKDHEDENYRKKMKHDNDVYLDNLFRKKKLEQETLDKIGDQLNDNAAQRKLNAEEAKKPHLTSVPIPEKQNKCYNCKLCKHTYPLKMLNKKKKL